MLDEAGLAAQRSAVRQLPLHLSKLQQEVGKILKD